MNKEGYLIEQEGLVLTNSASNTDEFKRSHLALDTTLVSELKAYSKNKDFHSLASFIATVQFLHYRYSYDEQRYTFNAVIYTDKAAADNNSNGIPYTCQMHDELTFNMLCKQADTLLKALPQYSVLPDVLDTQGFVSIQLPNEDTSKGVCSIVIERTFEGAISVDFYCPDANDFATVFTRSNTHYANGLKGLVTTSTSLIRTYPYIGFEELQLLAGYNHGPVDEAVSTPTLLHKLFEQSTILYPENPAIQSNEKIFSYSEINKRANKLSHYLIGQGLKPGDTAGIWLKRCTDVYVSMLAIMKAGAAYVPLDPGYPKDRVTYILGDCNARLLITETSFEITDVDCENSIVIDINKTVYNTPDVPDTNPDILLSPDSTAYIIYTSGTTGTPKGVLLPHKNICNLVKAEGVHFGVRPDDRVLQGFSVAFDASLEEIWLAFYAGALLVLATEKAMHSGEALTDYLVEKGITIFSTVPTMLSMMRPEIPLLRILILGGEAARYELMEKWQLEEGRRIINSYGPTEATVIATYADFEADKRVTIGKPIINYSTYILDTFLNLVPIGIPGELHIGGKGIATGYLNNKTLTDKKFIELPAGLEYAGTNRAYKSGDLAYINEDGDIAFIGRIDTQVKLRGFRVELSEIEAQLMQSKGVELAVIKVHEGVSKVQRLVAYVKETAPGSFVEADVKEYLRTKLAVYMMPSVFIILADFPVLPSGKVDRKKLPDPETESVAAPRDITLPQTNSEQQVYELWQKYFAPHPVSTTDNFFELGGHSLLATMVVSELRKHKEMSALSVQDVYTFPVLTQLAAHIDQLIAKKKSGASNTVTNQQATKVHPLTFVGISLLQGISVFVFYMLTCLFMLTPFYFIHHLHSVSLMHIVGIIVASVVLFIPMMMLVSCVLKWTLIGRFKQGSHPLWGFYYFRFWLVKKFVDIIPLTLLTGTPLLTFYFRMMGAKIGKHVYMGTDRMRAFDLVSIGDDTSISKEVNLMGYTVENGELHIGTITIGKDCFVGVRSLFNLHTTMESHSSLGELSLLPANAWIPKGEMWQGSPAQLVSKQEDIDYQPIHINTLKYILYYIGQKLAFIFVFLVPLATTYPFIFLCYDINDKYGMGAMLVCVLPITALYVTTYCLAVAAVKWLILGKSHEENISIYSFKYIRKWTVDTLIYMSLLTFRSIYATIYLPSWLRLLGAKVGKMAEVSTVNQISTDLLTIGAGSFLADSVSIGSPFVRRGRMILRRAAVGEKTFIGNSAVLVSGKSVGNNALIGVLSIPPTADKETDNTSWLGTPPMFLPKRQIAEGFTDEQTFAPPVRMIVLRGVMEFFKITLPLALPLVLFAMFYRFVNNEYGKVPHWELILNATLSLITTSIAMVIFTVIAKWTLIGKYKPQQKPLWSTFVWRNELVNSLCESMVYPYFVNFVMGTPFASWFFQLMGSGFGNRVFMETTEITEFDLVKVSDDVALNYGCTIQTHLFEDRIMKMSYLYIRRGCSVGSMAVVLYSSEMEQASSLNGLSLLMKGEVLPANTRWQGSPASNA